MKNENSRELCDIEGRVRKSRVMFYRILNNSTKNFEETFLETFFLTLKTGIYRFVNNWCVSCILSKFCNFKEI